MFWVQLLRFLLTAAVMGLLAHIIGEALPRRWFRAEAFPYRAYAWEQNGKFYQKLGIRAWKDRLPDKSRLVRSAYRKSVAAHHEAGSMDRLVPGNLRCGMRTHRSVLPKPGLSRYDGAPLWRDCRRAVCAFAHPVHHDPALQPPAPLRRRPACAGTLRKKTHTVRGRSG